MSYSEAFRKAVERTLEHEGGYVDDPQDAGGETHWGISKRAYPHLDIKNLTKEQAMQIYYTDYWCTLGLGALHPEVAIELFDTAVNLGRSGAVRVAQRALAYLGRSVMVDGQMGPQTREALNSYPDREALLKTLNGVQFAEYLRLVEANPKLKKFARGWLKRVEIKEAA